MRYPSFMPSNRLLCRTARNSSRGGFTLVELLVVISIIAILAGVALPAITGAVKKANENAALQTAHGLSLAMFQYCNDNGSYPGSSAVGVIPVVNITTSSQGFGLLVYAYISNTDALTINGAGQQKFTGSYPAAPLTSANVSWDMTVLGTGLGVTSNDPDQLPLIMSTGSTITYGTLNTPGAATAVITTANKNPFGNDGIAVGYHDCSSAFKVSQTIGAAFNVSSASLDPINTYNQLKP
jgi:prepilin-type N-terminal cleavage/methylation domain-containing protein